ncbi:MAG: exosortase H-associated membrane protein [Pseudomonadota bacterium]
MPSGRLIRRMLAWLPLTYGLWYAMAPAVAMLLAGLLQPLLKLLSGGLVFAVEREGRLVQAVVRLGAGSYGELVVPAGRFAELLIEAQPMIYGYGVPLFVALVLAAGRRQVSWRAWLLSAGGLLSMLVFGVGMGLLKGLVFDLHPSISALLSVQPFQRELIALGYQLGFLMLPVVVPLIVWFVLYADLLVELTRMRAPDNTTPI